LIKIPAIIISIFLNILVILFVYLDKYSNILFFLWIISPVLLTVSSLKEIRSILKKHSIAEVFLYLRNYKIPAGGILLNTSVILLIYWHKYSNILIFLWILSLVLFLIPSLQKIKFNFKLSKKVLLIFLIISLPALIRILNLHSNRIHGDEFILAYYSSQYDFQKDNFFSAIPVLKNDWVCQYPPVFFAMQKIFFLFFGGNFVTIKLSVIPYIIIISLMLYLLTRDFLGEKTDRKSVV